MNRENKWNERSSQTRHTLFDINDVHRTKRWVRRKFLVKSLCFLCVMILSWVQSPLSTSYSIAKKIFQIFRGLMRKYKFIDINKCSMRFEMPDIDENTEKKRQILCRSLLLLLLLLRFFFTFVLLRVYEKHIIFHFAPTTISNWQNACEYYGITNMKMAGEWHFVNIQTLSQSAHLYVYAATTK